MELKHDFTISAPLEAVWPILIDPRQSVTALPGVSITALEGESFTGQMAIKLGR